MQPMHFTIAAHLRLWPERKDRWVHLPVPPDLTEALDAVLEEHPRGFRSIPVRVTASDEQWQTGLFRYRDGSWTLPVKQDVLGRSGLDVGDRMTVDVQVVEEA